MPRFFEDRRRAAEMLFVRSEQARFVVHCNRVQALAAHAAELLGVDRQSAQSYADELTAASIQGANDPALVERVRADLEANGVVVAAADLARYLGAGVPASGTPARDGSADPAISQPRSWN